MFEQSILVRQRTSKCWSVLLSLAAELAGIGLLAVLPLIWAERLPASPFAKIALWLQPLQSEAQAPETPVRPQTPGTPRPFVDTGLRAPTRVPQRLDVFADPVPELVDPAIFGTTDRNAIAVGIPLSDLAVRAATPPERPVVKRTVTPVPPRPIRVSRLEGAKILYRVIPAYPPLARATHTTGTVRLIGVIATDGTIQSLRVVSGHPLLTQAALDAVRQWRFKPTILNGQPVEVEAPIDVTFTLQ